MKVNRIGSGIAVVLLIVAMATVSPAHQTAESEHFAEVNAAEGTVVQQLSIAAEDLAHHLGHTGHGEEPTVELLEEIRDQLHEYLDENTGIRADSENCQREDSEFLKYPGDDGRVHLEQRWQCPAGAEEIEFANRIMLDTHGGYRHTARIEYNDSQQLHVFDQNYPTTAIYPPSEDAEEEQQPPQIDPADQRDETGVDDGVDTAPEQPEPGDSGLVALVGLVVIFIAALILFRRT